MGHLLHRNCTYYFNRRVPLAIRDYDNRRFVRFSLKTDSKTQAEKQAALENAKLEQYWQSLIATGKKHESEYYKQVVDRASLLGFPYMASQVVATAPIEELFKRLLHIDKHCNNAQAEAVLGGVNAPVIKLEDALVKFWDLSNDIILNKSAHQVKKWQNPRKLAMKNLIACIGNKDLLELAREDLLKFRGWWIARIEAENLGTSVANKNFIQLKVIIGRVVEHYKMDVDVKHIFSKLIFENEYEPRPPIPIDHLRNVLLNPENLKGMNKPSRDMLRVFAETGMCLAEQLCLLPEDIILNSNIPHVSLVPRKKSKLKTKYRKRVIPLTGYALEVFRANPNGFAHIFKNPDSLSSAVNKYLRENNLFPSDKHSVYSLRHSFQDRLTNTNAPDRIQADLMGHKFQRPLYGEGATLEHKLEWMEKIKLKNY